MAKVLKGPFDRFYKKNSDGYYDWDGLENELEKAAIRVWELKGFCNDLLCIKLDSLRREIEADKWSYNQRIAVGNSYYNELKKLKGGGDERTNS